MPIQGLLHGLEIGLAEETAKARQDARAREDDEFQRQLKMLDAVRQTPGFDPELYKQVLGDTLKLSKGMGAKRKPVPGLAGFFGQTETGPYASELLKNIQSGAVPIFNDPASTKKATANLSNEDLRGVVQDGKLPQAPDQGVPPPPPVQSAPAGAPPAPQGPQSAGGSQGPAPTSGGAPGAPQPPAGPVPHPAGSADMLGAAVDLSKQVSASGPMAVPPPPPSSDSQRPPGSSLFRSGQQQAEHDATAQAAGAGIKQQSDLNLMANKARTVYEQAIKFGASPEEAKRAALKEISGYTGGMATHQGQLYVVPDPSGGNPRLVKSLLQTDQYGGYKEIDPQTQSEIPPDARPYIAGQDVVETDAKGVTRIVNKPTGTVRGTQAVGGGQAQPPGVVAGKPQIPPAPQLISGTLPSGAPGTFALPRAGANAPNPTATAVQGAGSAPLEKFVKPEPYSANAAQVVQSTLVVQNLAQEALKTVQDLRAKGFNPTNPIPQEIAFKIYQMGWPNADADEDKLNQLLGAAGLNGMKAYMGGRPNQKLMDIIKVHLPEPGDSLELTERKIGELMKITNTVKEAVDVAEGLRRKFPWQTTSGTGSTVPPPPSAAPKTVTPALLNQYAKEHNITVQAATAAFKKAGISVGPAAAPARQ